MEVLNRMKSIVIIGSQWGDEGKGKIVDWLAEKADVIVRFQGGHNAGHTLVVDGITYKLSVLPSGIVRPNKLSLIANGVILDPWAFLNEIALLKKQNVEINPLTLKVCEKTALILPVHRNLDQAREELSTGSKIGTTGRGIGPAYEDKIGRRSIRFGDLKDTNTLKERIKNLLIHHNIIRRGMNMPEVSPEKLFSELESIIPELLPYSSPVWLEINKLNKSKKRILFEGAQGTMLDIDHGTYPFVTSSNTVSAQAAIGSGQGPNSIGYVLGITKAYTTRVGEGPFPTELHDDVGVQLGTRGHEVGTVTGRPRRCGWFDATLVKQAVIINGISGIALTKIDVLDHFEELKIGIGYSLDGEIIDYFPSSIEDQKKVVPIFETIKGWDQNVCGMRILSQLPKACINYIRRIEELIETPISIISTSPERNDTILIHDPYN